MANEIKFSVIVPVFNVEKYLEECVHSVLCQTYDNYEIILVDDGSKDDSGKICDHYAKKYATVKAFHKANEGQIATRCYGLKYATGDYIVFLDSDDMLEENALQVIFDNIVNYEADCVVYEWVRFREDVLLDTPKDFATQVYETKREIYKKILSDGKYNSLCIKCMKRSAFQDIDYSDYFHIRYGEDLLQSIDALSHCKRAVFIPNPLYRYRVNMSSVTRTLTFENFVVDFTVGERTLDFIKRNCIFTENDLDDYRAYCINVFVKQIIRISRFDASKKQKIQLFQDIKNASYYRDFLNKGKLDRKRLGKQAIIFTLFRNGSYTILFSLINIAKKRKR